MISHEKHSNEMKALSSVALASNEPWKFILSRLVANFEEWNEFDVVHCRRRAGFRGFLLLSLRETLKLWKKNEIRPKLIKLIVN